MTKMLVDLDRALVDAAKAALGEITTVGTIRAALRRVVSDAAWRDLLDHLAGLDDDQVAALRAARED